MDVTHFDVVHFHDLLLISRLRFTFPMVEGRLGFLSPVFDFLTCPVITPFHFLQIAVGRVALLFQLRCILGMALS